MESKAEGGNAQEGIRERNMNAPPGRRYSSFSTIMNFICASLTICPSTEHFV